MKNKFILMLSFLILLFIGITPVSASEELLKTDTEDEIIFIKDQNGKFSYSWTFDKQEYNLNEFEFDLGINFSSKKKSIIDLLSGKNIKKKYISFDHHGKLPTSAVIKTDIKDTFKDAKTLNLYYYNEDKETIEFIDEIDVKNGYVSFEINHCSDYFLTNAVVKEAEGNKNNGGIIIIAMIIIITGLIGYTLFNNKR